MMGNISGCCSFLKRCIVRTESHYPPVPPVAISQISVSPSTSDEQATLSRETTEASERQSPPPAPPTSGVQPTSSIETTAASERQSPPPVPSTSDEQATLSIETTAASKRQSPPPVPSTNSKQPAGQVYYPSPVAFSGAKKTDIMEIMARRRAASESGGPSQIDLARKEDAVSQRGIGGLSERIFSLSYKKDVDAAVNLIKEILKELLLASEKELELLFLNTILTSEVLRGNDRIQNLLIQAFKERRLVTCAKEEGEQAIAQLAFLCKRKGLFQEILILEICLGRFSDKESIKNVLRAIEKMDLTDKEKGRVSYSLKKIIEDKDKELEGFKQRIVSKMILEEKFIVSSEFQGFNPGLDIIRALDIFTDPTAIHNVALALEDGTLDYKNGCFIPNSTTEIYESSIIRTFSHLNTRPEDLRILARSRVGQYPAIASFVTKQSKGDISVLQELYPARGGNEALDFDNLKERYTLFLEGKSEEDKAAFLGFFMYSIDEDGNYFWQVYEGRCFLLKEELELSEGEANKDEESRLKNIKKNLVILDPNDIRNFNTKYEDTHDLERSLRPGWLNVAIKTDQVNLRGYSHSDIFCFLFSIIRNSELGDATKKIVQHVIEANGVEVGRKTDQSLVLKQKINEALNKRFFGPSPPSTLNLSKAVKNEINEFCDTKYRTEKPRRTTHLNYLKCAYLFGEVAKNGALGYEQEIEFEGKVITENNSNNFFYILCQYCLERMAEAGPTPFEIESTLMYLRRGACIQLVMEDLLDQYQFNLENFFEKKELK